MAETTRQTEMELFMNYHPNSRSPCTESTECSPKPKLTAPIVRFYEKHLDEQLILKHTVASTLMMYPRAFGWYECLKLVPASTKRREESIAYTEPFSLQFYVNMLDECRNAMDEKTRDLLHQMRARNPIMAFWEFFAVSEEIEKLFRDMLDIGATDTLHWEKCLTTGHKTSSVDVVRPMDSETTPWGTVISDHPDLSGVMDGKAQQPDTVQHHHRRGDNPTASNEAHGPWPSVTVPPTEPSATQPLAGSFLQRPGIVLWKRIRLSSFSIAGILR
ncbi:hypothetical protein DXG01_003484 [Tephrocybe rancida]|nr:hypothetical protein DXG01_003484 [Tephrocybe rancida]